MSRHLHRILLGIGFVTVTVLTLAAAPAPAEAQWHGHVRFYVSFGGYWPYRIGDRTWGPHFGFGFGYPWGGPYPYGPYRAVPLAVLLRLGSQQRLRAHPGDAA